MAPRRLEAAVFDLDGVITRTATVHARAWKGSFDLFLAKWSKKTGVPQAPFDEIADYLAHVDGKPRQDGVADFLRAREIEPTPEMINEIGTEKNGRYLRLIDEEGVEVFESSVRLIRNLRRDGVKTAVASSSRNCARILQSAGLTGIFDARVDGNDLAALKLPGKPAPDLFLEAARRIGADPARSAVFEDASSGVEAGVRADFAVVVGVAREKNVEELRLAGAHIVVEDIDELDERALLDLKGLEKR